MKWRRSINPLRREAVSRLRHVARHDPAYARALAVELLNDATDLSQRGLHEEAHAVLDEIVVTIRHREAAAATEPDTLLLATLTLLGSTLIELGRVTDAEAAFEEAAGLARQVPDSRRSTGESALATCLVSLALCREYAGDNKAALLLVGEAEEILRSVGDSDPGAPEQLEAAKAVRARLLPPAERRPQA